MNSGKRLRTFHLVAPLAARHEITFVCRRHEGSDSQSLDSFGIRTVVVNHPIRKKTGPIFYAALFNNLFSKHPYTVSSHRSPLLTDTIETLHREKPFDLVHCEWTPYAVNLGGLWKIPSVVDAHNVESMIWKRNYEIEGHLLRKAFFRLQWQKMHRFERQTLPRFSRVVAVSEPDRAVMSGWVEPGRIDIVDNGVDTEYFKPSGVQPKPHSMVFTGSLDWRPNVDAMLYFLESIWPIIRGRHPEATIAIVGRNPMDALREKAAGLPGVDLVGTVDDVRPYMARAAVFVVPLRIGGGSRLKILEAMAMEKAVVSSVVGAEGLEVADAENILLADSPNAFATAVGKLFEERELRKRLETAGRTLARRRYEWSGLSRKLEKVWGEATAHSRVAN